MKHIDEIEVEWERTKLKDTLKQQQQHKKMMMHTIYSENRKQKTQQRTAHKILYKQKIDQSNEIV